MQPPAIVLHGVALHRGTPASVRIEAKSGPIVLAQGDHACPRDALRITRTDRGVTLASHDDRVSIDLVEHLFAALGGLGIDAGVRISTNDPELPLLDGGAARFVEALRSLDLQHEGPSLVVAREATLLEDGAIYRFTPASYVQVEVEVAFRAPVGEERAQWSGDAADFAQRIAPARTFGWVDEYEALRAAGRAAGVDLASVLVFDAHGAIAGCRPAAPTEVARHKLLDLIGDLAIHGGPPRGAIHARAPGHTRTHAVVRKAIAQGVLVRTEARPS